MGDIIIILIAAVLLLPGPIFTILNVRNLILRREQTGKFEVLAFTVGILYTLLLYGIWSPRAWDEGIWIYFDQASLHEPISREHVLTVIAFWIVGLLCYGYLKSKREKAAPLAAVLSMAGVYLGIAINVLIVVQLYGSAAAESPFENFIFPDVLLMMLVPLNYILLAVDLLVRTVRSQSRKVRENQRTEEAEEMETRQPYKSRILNDCNRMLSESENWALYSLLLALPLLCLIVTVLLLFGQKPDSMIRAFTETSDWTLSVKISPPPVTADAHYLCTVALQGHEELVRPTRMGLRRGEKIVVNRQLCVANAFEQLLEERTPRFHRALRNFYDTYGYQFPDTLKHHLLQI